MNRLAFLLLLLLGSLPGVAVTLPDDFNPERAAREGQALTADLLARIPSRDYTNTGVLEIRPRRGGETVELPLRITVQAGARRWIGFYEVLGSRQTNRLDTLTIVNEADGSSHYFPCPPTDLAQTEPLTDAEVATTRFAGSDFWVGDLGLEFLRWPVQRLLKKDMIRGQSCNVLESVRTTAPPDAYGRVIAWLDIDTGGIVLAEAYDAQGKRVKEFLPKSFKKVDGEWQLKEMRIEDLRTKSRTTMTFDVGTGGI